MAIFEKWLEEKGMLHHQVDSRESTRAKNAEAYAEHKRWMEAFWSYIGSGGDSEVACQWLKHVHAERTDVQQSATTSPSYSRY
jgi:hypothetical protein